MIKLKNTLCAFLALSVAAGTAVPLSAAPLPSPRVFQDAAKNTDVTNIQYRDRRQYRERRGYYRGYRGYRERRPGYRYRNGYWFPAAAFIAGAIVGGALSNNRGGGSHVRWCENRWRSYRAYDNTYQPSNGPRRICVSPYS
jgi:hypothetical protein